MKLECVEPTNLFLHVATLQAHPVPLFWQYEDARKLFLEGARAAAQELVWTEPDEEGLVQLLCRTMHVKWVGSCLSLT